MVVTFIINPSFRDMTFQVKHLMIGHVLDGACLYRLTAAGFFFKSSNIHRFNGLLLMANFLCWEAKQDHESIPDTFTYNKNDTIADTLAPNKRTQINRWKREFRVAYKSVEVIWKLGL